MVCSGGVCSTALNDAVDETMGDLGVEGKVVAGAFEGYCEDGFVWVPGSAKYGTLPGFCIMQDLAAGDGLNPPAPFVKGGLNPVWTAASQGEADLACQTLGSDYHLISENEWLTIAENIVKVAANDIDQNTAGLQLATITLDGTPVAHKLTNDNIIYNLAGSVAEWTNQTVTEAGNIKPASDNWQEYYEIADYQGFNIAPPYYYTSANGIGKILTGDNTNNLRGFVRGNGGIYGLDLSHAPDEQAENIGFRCAK
jgi:hypothetical protein